MASLALSLPPTLERSQPRPAVSRPPLRPLLHSPASIGDTVPEAEVSRPPLRPLVHPPESMEGIPYYDEELDMAQSLAHSQTIRSLGSLLDRVAAAAGLLAVSDNPVWYWPPDAPQQKALYPDYALTANPDASRLMATELVLAVEVVSTAKPVKEAKDTVKMRDYNAAHGVPEFLLIYPEPDDPRSVVWHRYDARRGRYQVVRLPANQRYRSVAIPGLEVEVLPQSAWQFGRKVRVWFEGVEFREAAAEAARAEQEHARAEQEAQARQAAEQRAARLAERLRAMGIDPSEA